MLTMDGQGTAMDAWLYYKLTYEASAQVSSKNLIFIIEILQWKSHFWGQYVFTQVKHISLVFKNEFENGCCIYCVHSQSDSHNFS